MLRWCWSEGGKRRVYEKWARLPPFSQRRKKEGENAVVGFSFSLFWHAEASLLLVSGRKKIQEEEAEERGKWRGTNGQRRRIEEEMVRERKRRNTEEGVFPRIKIAPTRVFPSFFAAGLFFGTECV